MATNRRTAKTSGAIKTTRTTAKRPSARKTAKRAAERKPVATSRVSANVRLGARVEYRIYPSIGIARVGNSKDGFVEGPEAPGLPTEGPFRGSDGGLKPQAVRFRIYKVEIDANENEKVTAEIVPDATTKVQWSVDLANRKAAAPRIIETLARSANPRLRNPGFDRKKLVISASAQCTGKNAARKRLTGAIEFAKAGAPSRGESNIELASVATDASGRLWVIGGPGKSGSPLNTSADSFADNDGWYDSVSDGPVRASLTIDGKALDVVPAWVVVTVPRYAPGIYGIVTWYDQAVSMARSNDDGTFSAPKSTSFTRDIYPILKRADALRWVHRTAHGGAGPTALSDAARLAQLMNPAIRSAFVSRLTTLGTDAGNPEVIPPNMPKLNSGANPDAGGPTWAHLSLTRYQHAHMKNWVLDNFDDDWPGAEPAPVPFNKTAIGMQPRALCEAALECCVGGSFYPGIEATYDMARRETYHPETRLRKEFRVDPRHPSGYLTEKMALPWQADFADCSDFWWPSQRPVLVKTAAAQPERWDRGITGVARNAHLNMVDFWPALALVTRDAASGEFVETDRRPFDD